MADGEIPTEDWLEMSEGRMPVCDVDTGVIGIADDGD
jgi:hypothetical protein